MMTVLPSSPSQDPPCRDAAVGQSPAGSSPASPHTALARTLRRVVVVCAQRSRYQRRQHPHPCLHPLRLHLHPHRRLHLQTSATAQRTAPTCAIPSHHRSVRCSWTEWRTRREAAVERTAHSRGTGDHDPRRFRPPPGRCRWPATRPLAAVRPCLSRHGSLVADAATTGHNKRTRERTDDAISDRTHASAISGGYAEQTPRPSARSRHGSRAMVAVETSAHALYTITVRGCGVTVVGGGLGTVPGGTADGVMTGRTMVGSRRKCNIVGSSHRSQRLPRAMDFLARLRYAIKKPYVDIWYCFSNNSIVVPSDACRAAAVRATFAGRSNAVIRTKPSSTSCLTGTGTPAPLPPRSAMQTYRTRCMAVYA